MLRLLLATAAVAGAVLAVPAAAAPGQPVAPYHDPAWGKHCRFHHFKEAQAPKLDGYPDDPLCVEYAKRDITVDNGGAIRFAEAEPARFAIAGQKCRYWQVDHWSVQLDRAYGAVVRWDGSYWFDRAAGEGGAIARHFTIAGQPVGAAQAAAAVATVSPQAAAQIRAYEGASFALPVAPGCGS